MATRGAATPQVTHQTQKRSSKMASQQSLNHLLNFTLPPRQTSQAQGPSRRNRKHGTQQGVWNKERFVNAQYRFIMNPLGDYTVHFADPDIFFQWQDILQVIIPRTSASASAAGGGGMLQDEGHLTCPICLSPPAAPRMTKCGHVFCFPCILHYLSTSDNLKWVRCPICFDSVHERQLKSVQWFDGIPQPEDELDDSRPEASSSSSSIGANSAATPQPGSMLRMRLMQRPQITTLALPRSPTWPSDLLPPHQAPFHFLPDVYTFSKFMLATPAYLIEHLNRELNEIALEKQTLSSMGDVLGVHFAEAAEERLQVQIAKATALDTEPLRNAADKALQLQYDIESRATLNSQRKQQGAQADPESSDVPDAYLATRASGMNLPAVIHGQDITTSTPSRNSKQRRNLNPPPPSTSTYYYYQAASGMPIFLHPLDIKILNAHFNGYASFPDSITVRVEAYSEGSVNDDLRKRCKYLAHMPEGANVVFVEADLTEVVGVEGLRNFEGTIKMRRTRRKDRERKDDRARVRAEEREREKIASMAWRETGSVPAYLPQQRTESSEREGEEVQSEQSSRPTPQPVSGAWGTRSFASALHSTPSTPRTPVTQRSQRREGDSDEWDLDSALNELEQRVSSGVRGKKGRLVVLGGGPGRRR